MSKNTKEILNLILEDAIQGKIKLENLYTRWPFEKLDNDIFYKQMFEDIESAIEHTPFNFFTKKVNFKIWKETREYKMLLHYKAAINE